ncbi:MAG TPA: family 43 glycosylhydrolase [Kofleriaceae bacterium]|nr:family 43 glycosylhydrolase [Kofleriaceae bacterium]
MRSLWILLAACSASPKQLPVPDAAEPAQHGLHGAYYSGPHDLVHEAVDPQLELTWPATAPAFEARWTGTLVPPAPGDYVLSLDASDGARVWLGGARVLDGWTAPAATATVTLAGPTSIKVTLYARAGGHVTLAWTRPDGTTETIPSSALEPDAGDPTLAAPAEPYANSVDDTGCADPGALAVGGTYYVACTGGRFRIRTSPDLATWTATDHYILPAGGASWSSTTDFRWAPEIHAVHGRYVAYFVSADGQGRRAIGAAVADTPLGPYTVQSSPLVTDPVGVIDPTYFEDDDGTGYLIYKFAGSSVGQPTPIYLRALRADGLAFAAGSAPIELIRNDLAWEGPLVEAPWLVKRNGMYYLFYSGNVFDERYRVGVARAASVRGPYTKHGAPILGNNAKWLGPGHNSSVQVDGIDYLVYHAWHATPAGAPDQTRGRVLMVDRVDWGSDGWPVIDTDGTPSMSARPRPGLDPDP